MEQGNVPTFSHEITLDALDGLSQTVNPASNLFCELLSSVFPCLISFFSPLRVLKFALRECDWTGEQKRQKNGRVCGYRS